MAIINSDGICDFCKHDGPGECDRHEWNDHIKDELTNEEMDELISISTSTNSGHAITMIFDGEEGQRKHFLLKKTHLSTATYEEYSELINILLDDGRTVECGSRDDELTTRHENTYKKRLRNNQIDKLL